MPFTSRPCKDGGYDISDSFTVLPEYGDLGDVVDLVEQAHRRGIRIIADLVMNHTSDQHPWFQESRQDRTNRRADWYVWSDDDQQWPDAKIIFCDVEHSNWTWDPQREQYYWHRFFSHQPDLNFANLEVQEAMLEVLRFWLDLGLDGFRLDAVPYLFERDGTTGENLPETHEYLKRVRKEVDAHVPGPGASRRGRSMAGRGRRLLRRVGRRVPHVLPLPTHAAHVHGGEPGAAPADHRHPRPDAGDPRRAASGASSCATTTS